MLKQFRIAISFTLITAFVGSSLYMPQAQAGEMVMLRLPVPGVMVHLSPQYSPAHLQGLTIHPENALQFDFLVHKGDGQLDSDQKRQEYTKLVKYFLASLTIPDADQWVNLSPYEHNRIIKDDFGKTEMGRDLLSQDYLLKQVTSSLMYPGSGLGKAFWDKVYERAFKEYGTTNVPVNTFNKVWIIPDEAVVYESGNTVYILRNHLKVMLEEDYLSLQKHSAIVIASEAKQSNTHTIASKIVKEIILPELAREVNEGKNFAMLRQIYSGMILATWYKHALKESLLGQVYANKAKVVGIVIPAKAGIQKMDANVIYQQYLKAFKKGVFNYIKEDADKYSQQLIPRKYFAGGIVGITSVEMGPGTATRGFRDGAMKVENEKTGLDPQSFAGAKIIVTAATEGQIEEVYTDLTSVQVGIKKGLTDEDIKRKTQEIVDYLNRVHIIADIRSGFALKLSLQEIMARAESKVQNLINRAVSEKLADLDYEDIGRIAERIKYELSNIRYPGLVSVEFKSIDAAMSLEEHGYKDLNNGRSKMDFAMFSKELINGEKLAIDYESPIVLNLADGASFLKIMRVAEMEDTDPDKGFINLAAGFVITDGKGGTKELRNGEVVKLGRFYLNHRFKGLDQENISRGHITISRQGDQIILRDGVTDVTTGKHQASANGTVVEWRRALIKKISRWLYDRLRRPSIHGTEVSRNENEIFEIGQEFTAHGHKINGGENHGRNTREVIVVDFKRDRNLNKLYDLVNKGLAGVKPQEFFKGTVVETGIKGKLIGKIFSAIESNVQYIISPEHIPGKVIFVGDTVETGGVCRHMGILVAALLERFINEGKLQGKVYYIRGRGHGWAVYETSDGRPIVLDVAQHNIGYQNDMQYYGGNGYYLYREPYQQVKLLEAAQDVAMLTDRGPRYDNPAAVFTYAMAQSISQWAMNLAPGTILGNPYGDVWEIQDDRLVNLQNKIFDFLKSHTTDDFGRMITVWRPTPRALKTLSELKIYDQKALKRRERGKDSIKEMEDIQSAIQMEQKAEIKQKKEIELICLAWGFVSKEKRDGDEQVALHAAHVLEQMKAGGYKIIGHTGQRFDRGSSISVAGYHSVPYNLKDFDLNVFKVNEVEETIEPTIYRNNKHVHQAKVFVRERPMTLQEAKVYIAKLPLSVDKPNIPSYIIEHPNGDAAMTVGEAKKMVEDALKELKENLAPEGLDPKLYDLENEFKLFQDLTGIPEVLEQLTKLIEEYRSRPSTFYSEAVKDKIIGKLSSVNLEISRALYRERRMGELPMVVSSPFAPNFYTDVMGARNPIKLENVPTLNSTPLSLSERFRLWVQIIDRQVRNKLNTGNKTSTNDAAMKVKDLGGIDLNSANLNLQIKRDGRGVPLPLVQQDWAQLNQIQGFIPTIIEIRPVTTLPILSELQQKLRAS